MPEKQTVPTTLSPGLALAEASQLRRKVEREGLSEALKTEIRALLQRSSPPGRVAAQSELEGAVPAHVLG